MSSVSLASRRGHFSTFSELIACIRASMLVPGLAGPLLSVPAGELADSAQENESNRGSKVKLSSRARSWAAGQWRRSASLKPFGKGGEEKGAQEKGGAAFTAGSTPEDIATASTVASVAAAAAVASPELLVDAMVFEPLPYR